MKKILLGTTTLVGAAMLSHAALADAPKVTLGGTSEFQAGFVSDDVVNQRGHGFRNDNEISVKVDGKSDMGLGYGAEVWLEADVTPDADNQSTANAAKTFLYVDGAWGRLEGGSTLGPDQTLKIGAESIARATGGIDGDWTYFTSNLTGKAGSAAQNYIATPDLPLNYGGIANGLGTEGEENATKLVYYTPKWNGLQAGVAYVPAQDGRGQTLSLADNTPNQSEKILVGGVNYTGEFSGVTVGLAATGERGNGETTATEDLRAYQVGGKLGYMGFSVAGSYGNWDDSNQTATNLDKNKFWTAGAAYETGPYGVSFTYLDSEYDAGATKNDFTSYSVGADYKLAPGLTPYVEFTHFDMDPTGTVNDNEGHVFLVGSSLNF